MTARVAVIGGAGYIGSHMVKALVRAGYPVRVFDNLSTGCAGVVPHGLLTCGDMLAPATLEGFFKQEHCDVVMHFAASCYVGESVLDPIKYYRNNVAGTVNLLEAMRKTGVTRLVYSSTCATYGDPVTLPIDESHPQQPVNPYGRSKRIAEQVMEDCHRAHGLRTVALRYFNAAGCDSEGELGERHDPETHLIPLVLQEALRVRGGGEPGNTMLRIYGDDYPTPDGTCIRDYVHVEDLCAAHLLAMRRLLAGEAGGFEAFNLGSERGASVKEVIETCRKVTGADILYRVGPRRAGDPPSLIADSRKARDALDWAPRHGRLEDIVGSAWTWLSRQARR